MEHILGTICDVVSYDGSDMQNTVLVCRTRAQPNSHKDVFYGNRGLNLFRVNVSTPGLGSSPPPSDAEYMWLDEMNYVDTGNSDVTIWMMGFLVPAVTSDYTFSLTMNSGTVGRVFFFGEDEPVCISQDTTITNGCENF